MGTSTLSFRMSQKILTFSFYVLFFFTPLFWRSINFELFEYNKMMLVYFLTIIITASWVIKSLQSKTFIFKRTPLDLPILLFLLANILSTIFSIDPHTSLWGYYSRSNGGLYSLISYILLYYALVANFESLQVIKFLKTALFGGLIVALWAIPEHFSVSPSCILLTGEFNASCWVQHVQDRVFATLGQPNWLAAYLAMLIFPAIYFLLQARKLKEKIFYYLLILAYYLAFTFTYSRGGTLGLLAGLFIFALFFLWQTFPQGIKKIQLNLSVLKNLIFKSRILSAAILTFLAVNLIFGSAIYSFKLSSKFTSTSRPALTTSLTKPSGGTQLETGGTESGTIRLIVWRGAWEIFKHYPILGSGVETFAYSYYNFRPQEHNLVSEWDFLYNKAHNEYLNYLATTGIVGFATYIGLIFAYIVWSIKYILFRKDQKNLSATSYLLPISLLAAFISYLVQNFFGFSVVIIALFFFLFPAMAFIFTETAKPVNFSFLNFVYRRRFYIQTLTVLTVISAFLLTSRLFSYYQADIFFTQGSHYNEAGNPGRAYNNLAEAVDLNPGEPYYKSELGVAAAAAATVLSSDDATTSSALKDKALEETNAALAISPRNLSFLRTAVRTYFLLSGIDKSFTQKTLDTLDQTIVLAPTDPKLTYNKALILIQEGRNEEALAVLTKTITLKPDYREAHFNLATVYYNLGQKEPAKEQLKIILQANPKDNEAESKLQEWEKAK